MPDQQKPPPESEMDDLLELYRTLPREQPSADLSQRVLTDAARALEENKKTSPGGRLNAATTGMIVAAACTVIAIGIGVSIKDPTSELLDTSIPQASPPGPSAAARQEAVTVDRSEAIPDEIRARARPRSRPNVRPSSDSIPKTEVAAPAPTVPADELDGQPLAPAGLKQPERTGVSESAIDASTSQPYSALENEPVSRSNTQPILSEAEQEELGSRSPSPVIQRDRYVPDAIDGPNADEDKRLRNQDVEYTQLEAIIVSDPESPALPRDTAIWERLIEQARQAQLDRDRDRFENIKEQLILLFPQRTLPADLAEFNSVDQD